MTEETHRQWDTAIKILGFAGVIVGGIVGITQFHDQREREITQFAETKEREFYSQFWNERLRLYVKTLDTAAKISTATSLVESTVPRAEFWTLFDGSMAVVQDQAVDAAIHEFADQVRKVESEEISHKDLGIHSYQLGRVCYDSLKNSWNKPFSSLTDAKKH